MVEDVMTEVTAADIIEATVESLDEFGWCQGAAQNDEGEVCIAGAYGRGLRGREVISAEVWSGTWGLLNVKAREEGFLDIPSWNDHPDRTYGEVRDFLLGVAKDLRNEGGTGAVPAD